MQKKIQHDFMLIFLEQEKKKRKEKKVVTLSEHCTRSITSNFLVAGRKAVWVSQSSVSIVGVTKLWVFLLSTQNGLQKLKTE